MKLVAALCTLVATMLAVPAWGQETFPTRPIRIVVGFSPGGSTDILARVVGQRLSETMGQPVLVENRPGAGGSVAAGLVAKAAPDGYTLFLASTSHTINATYYQSLPYDTVSSFTGVAPIAVVPFVLAAPPSLGARSLAQFIATAKARPGQLNWGSAGNGTASHLAGEVFNNAAGITMTHVPYKGPAEQIQDVLAGRIDLALVPVNAAKAHVDAGRMVAVAVTTQRRSSVVDAPTVAEGGVAGYEFTPWFGLLAPAGTPRAIVDRLNAQVMAAINQPEVRARLQAQGAEPMQMGAAEFDALVRSEVTRFARVFRDAGVQRQ
jgi:tripartite-type tricarboxylate transporter receptor subunit TctC